MTVTCKTRGDLAVGLAAALSLIVFAATPDVAVAETRLNGGPDNVQVEASDTTLDELLAALHDRFGLTYPSTASLEQKVDGNYAGPLANIVKRLLKDYDHALKLENGRIVVVVIYPRKSTLQASATPARSTGVSPLAAGPAEGNSAGKLEPGKVMAAAVLVASADSPSPPPAKPPTMATILRAQAGPLMIPASGSASSQSPAGAASQSPAGAAQYPSQAQILDAMRRATEQTQVIAGALARFGR
jgi:hypothetical protein